MKSFVALPVALVALAAASLPAQAWFLPGELNLERQQSAVTSVNDLAYQSQRIDVRKPAAAWDDIY